MYHRRTSFARYVFDFSLSTSASTLAWRFSSYAFHVTPSTPLPASLLRVVERVNEEFGVKVPVEVLKPVFPVAFRLVCYSPQ